MANNKNNLIAKRYSDALIELVKESNLDVNNTSLQLKSILEDLKASVELSNFMENPIVSAEQKKEVVSSLLSGKVDELIINFLNLLIEKNRFGCFEEISNIFYNNVLEINNIKKVHVISAIELNDVLKNRLKEKLSSKLNKNIELETEVNVDIIAGLIIKIDDNVIDLSLEHRFEEMNKNLIK